jgi:hypothetical protein
VAGPVCSDPSSGGLGGEPGGPILVHCSTTCTDLCSSSSSSSSSSSTCFRAH